MPFTAEKDAEFGDAHFDVSKNEKRLIRVTLKTYERTGTHIFLKLFNKGEHDYELQQRITLTLEEFEKLSKKTPKILRQWIVEHNPAIKIICIDINDRCQFF